MRDEVRGQHVLERTSTCLSLLHGAGEIGDSVVVASSGDRTSGVAVVGDSDRRQAPSVTSLVFSFCAIKPMVACAVLAECDRLGCDPLGLVLRPGDYGMADPADAEDDYELTDLLAHLSGLVNPLILHVLVAPPSAFETLLRAGFEQAGSLENPTAQFSEVAAWELLLRHLGQALDCSTEEAMQTIFDRSGMRSSTVVPASGPESRLPVLHPLWDGPDRPVPMLVTTERQLSKHNRASIGAYVTVADLHLWWSDLVAHLRGTEVDRRGVLPSRGTLERAVGATSTEAHDASLDTLAPYGGGFMVDLQEHGWSDRWSPTALGHHGGGASVIGWCDPASGRAAAAFSGRFWLDPARRDAHIGELSEAVALDLDDLDSR